MIKKAFFIVLLFVPLQTYAECPTYIQPGRHHVMLMSYYGHNSPQNAPYAYATTLYAEGPTGLNATAEGHPVAHEWWVDGRLQETCGDVPAYWLFMDGFEDGDTGMWI